MAAITFDDLKGLVGKELGVSDWLVVDQDRINQFAACTEDRQWIHTDPERAAKQSPFGATIAHGYLTLSLLAGLGLQAIKMPSNLMAAVNYGLDKVRFLAPVKVGSRVRLRATLVSLEDGATISRVIARAIDPAPARAIWIQGRSATARLRALHRPPAGQIAARGSLPR